MFLYNSLSLGPETPPDSEIRGNSTPISFQKAGHAVPRPFLFLVFYVVTIVAAQSLQLGMVPDNLQLQLQSIVVFSWLFPLQLVLFCFTVSVCAKYKRVTCRSRPNRNF